MTAVRYLLRVGGLMLAGGAVFCGLVLLLNAQVLLNRYAELYMMDTAGSSAAEVPTNNVSAQPLAGVEPVSRAPTSDPHPAPLATRSEAGSTNGARAPEPQATPPVTIAKGEGPAAIYVSNAGSIAALDASDRRVDVVLTQHSGTSAAVSDVVLENVRVLTIELVAAESGIGERSAVHAVTLDVDADTAQDLRLASQAGKLSLALHRGGDNRHPAVRRTASPDVVDTPQFATPQVATPQAATPQVADSPQQVVSTLQAVDVPQSVSQPPVAAQDDDPHFTVVTVRRFGGGSSTYRVRREQ